VARDGRGPGLSNPARPPAGTVLCALADIADPGSKDFRFRADDRLFAGFVVRKGGRVYGYVDSCPHAGWPLAGPTGRHLTREGDLILCAGHGALFSIEDGVCGSGPCAGDRLTPWAVEIVGDQVVTG
jgi:nitrite reductase/ring-hydroxylating ferredoxin subunit